MKKKNILISYLFLVGVLIIGLNRSLKAEEMNNQSVDLNTQTSDVQSITENRAAGKFDLPDDVLEQYIMDAAGYTGALGTMDEAELSSLNSAFEFDVPVGVKTLEGLDEYISKGYFSNVEILGIGSPVQRIDALENLSITEMWISDTKGGIAQFPDMSNWTQLSKIKIIDNSDSTPIDLSLLNIGTMKNLTFLEINNSPNVINLDALGKSPSLTDLTIEDVPVDTSAINSIGNISTLENLTIIDAGLTDISGILNLPNLVALDLSSNQITDISAPSNLPNLMYLYLNDNQISNISTLENLTKLDELDLSNNQISDISVLENLNDLSYVYLSSNKISDFRPLETQYAAGTHIYGDSQSIDLNLGDFEDISEIPTEVILYWADGTETKIDYGFDPADITDFKEYSYGSFSFDSGVTEAGRPLFNGDITIRLSYVEPLPWDIVGPSIAIDTDGDGLSDEDENTIGTDINNKDTDGDGIDDKTEVENGTDPLTPESKLVNDSKNEEKVKQDVNKKEVAEGKKLIQTGRNLTIIAIISIILFLIVLKCLTSNKKYNK